MNIDELRYYIIFKYKAKKTYNLKNINLNNFIDFKYLYNLFSNKKYTNIKIIRCQNQYTYIFLA